MPGSDGGHFIASTPQQKSPNDCLFKSYGFGGTTDLVDPTSTLGSTELYEKYKVSNSRIYSSGDLLQPSVGVFSDYDDLQTWNKNAAFGRNPLNDNSCPNYPFPQTSWPYDFSLSQNSAEPIPQQIPIEPPVAKTSCHPIWPNPGSELYDEKVHVDFNSYYPSTACHSPKFVSVNWSFSPLPHPAESLNH